VNDRQSNQAARRADPAATSRLQSAARAGRRGARPGVYTPEPDAHLTRSAPPPGRQAQREATGSDQPCHSRPADAVPGRGGTGNAERRPRPDRTDYRSSRCVQPKSIASLSESLACSGGVALRHSPFGRLWLCAISPHRGSTGEEVTKLPEGYDVESYGSESYSDFEDFEPP
jgi:hypothetical protein